MTWIVIFYCLEVKDSETHKLLKSLHTNEETTLPSTDDKTGENLEDPESDLAGYSIGYLSVELHGLNEGPPMPLEYHQGT